MAQHEGPSQSATLSQELQLWMDQIDTAYNAFEAGASEARKLHGLESRVAFLNAQIDLLFAIGQANETIGRGPSLADMKSAVIESWPARPLSVAEERIVATAWAYRRRARLPDSGPKDSRMIAAMQIAAKMEGMHHDGAFETIRKSIQRYRKENLDNLYLRLNPETLKLELISGDLGQLLGIKGKTGKPKDRKL